MKYLILILLFTFTSTVFAEGIVKIQIGDRGKTYSQSDLNQRIWRLERAVSQLQQRVFQLESIKPPIPTSDAEWICKITAMGNTYSGVGGSKAVATHNAIENCSRGSGDGFFCKNATCEK